LLENPVSLVIVARNLKQNINKGANDFVNRRYITSYRINIIRSVLIPKGTIGNTIGLKEHEQYQKTFVTYAAQVLPTEIIIK